MPSTDAKPQELFDMQAALKRLGGSRELLAEMFQFFTEDAPELVQTLEKSLQDTNFDEAFRAAHSLKGLAANFDSFAVTKVAKQIEEATRKRDAQEASQLLPELRRNIDACMVEGRRLLHETPTQPR